jgi:hypothetical protein
MDERVFYAERDVALIDLVSSPRPASGDFDLPDGEVAS